MPARFRTRIEDIDWCGDDVLVVSIEKPTDYSFRAGQWFRLYLSTEQGEQGRTLSHAAAPGDSDLLIATRLSDSAFKRALATAAVGEAVEISAPGGRLSLPDPAVGPLILTGGVGVAPIRSLLRQARVEGRRFEDAVMFFGVRDDACIPFARELEELSDIGLRVIVVCEHPGETWSGERGLITPELIGRYVGDAADRPAVVTGPPAMVRAMELLLDELGIDEDLRTVERFGALA